jgi:hypothetical protein
VTMACQLARELRDPFVARKGVEDSVGHPVVVIAMVARTGISGPLPRGTAPENVYFGDDCGYPLRSPAGRISGKSERRSYLSPRLNPTGAVPKAQTRGRKVGGQGREVNLAADPANSDRVKWFRSGRIAPSHAPLRLQAADRTHGMRGFWEKVPHVFGNNIPKTTVRDRGYTSKEP